MLFKFPDTLPGYDPDAILSFEKIPYAVFSLKKSEGNKTVFLTEHTLMFIISGEKQISLSDRTLRIGENEILFLKRGIYVMTEYFPKEECFEVLLIFIPEAFLKKFIFERSHRNVKPDKEPYLILPSNDLLNSFKNHYKTYFGKEFSNLQYILNIKLQELFLLLTAAPSKRSLLDFIHSLVENNAPALDLIVGKYLFQPITIPELAKLSGRSTASFKRDFKNRYATSPRQWINRQRLHQARLLLNNTSKNISEICFECGYESVSYFIKIFKAEFGTTPAIMRKRSIIT